MVGGRGSGQLASSVVWPARWSITLPNTLVKLVNVFGKRAAHVSERRTSPTQVRT